MNKDTSNHFLDKVLDEKRQRVLTQLVGVVDGWYLAGGTALALQIGHRISYDFDFFTQGEIDQTFRRKVIQCFGKGLRFTMDAKEQLTFFTPEQVKITFAVIPFAPIKPLVRISGIIAESIDDIAADKAFTVGRRGAFRDYVDLFFLLAGHTLLSTVITDAQKKYESMFDEKLFLEQLDYLDDITDLSIEFIDKEIPKEVVQEFLHDQVRAYLKEKNAAF